MEGLRPRRQTAEDDTARNRVPAPVLPPCPTPGICLHPPLRIPGEPSSRGRASPLPRVVGHVAGVDACHHCEGFMRLALSQVWCRNDCRSEVQRGGILTMRLLRFLLGAGTGRIHQGVCTTPTRRCPRTFCAAHPALPTNRLDSFSISRLLNSEPDSRYSACVWPTQHRACRHQSDIPIP